MAITNENELAAAIREFDGLQDAAPGTPEARRRDELQGQIQNYYLTHTEDFRKGRPRAEE